MNKVFRNRSIAGLLGSAILQSLEIFSAEIKNVRGVHRCSRFNSISVLSVKSFMIQ